jgi:hypothetical protein
MKQIYQHPQASDRKKRGKDERLNGRERVTHKKERRDKTEEQRYGSEHEKEQSQRTRGNELCAVFLGSHLSLMPNVPVERRAAALPQPKLLDLDSSIPSDAKRSHAACPPQCKLDIRAPVGDQIHGMQVTCEHPYQNVKI